MKSFRNISSFIIEGCGTPTIELATKGNEGCLWVPSKLSSEGSIGFIELGDESGYLLKETFPGLVFGRIRIEKKVPPRSLVNDIFKKKISKIRSGGQIVSREDAALIKKSVVKNLLPKTLPSYIDIQFFFYNSKEEDRPSLLVFDKANSIHVEDSIQFLKKQGILTSPIRPFVPKQFYDNLTSRVLNGVFIYKDFILGDTVEFHSLSKGVYEKKIEPPFIIDSGEEINQISLSNSRIKFSLKVDGLLKSFYIFDKKTNKSEQLKLIVNLLHDLLKG